MVVRKVSNIVLSLNTRYVLWSVYCCYSCYSLLFVVVGVDSDEPEQRTEAGPVQRVSVLLRAAGVDWSPGSQSPGWSISHKAARSGPAGGGVPQVDT